MIVFQPRPLIFLYLTLLGLFCIGETILALRWRAKEGVAPADRGFLAEALTSFVLSNLLAVACLRFFPGSSFGAYFTSCLGLGAMLGGLFLRWWSIIYLGRFFTVNLAVSAGHRVIDSGPYRLIRHPSYAGLLLVIAGVALCFGNLVSILVLLIPCVALLLKRMRVEEAALAEGLGESYRAYMKRTKRLVPCVY
jgi:protein-S-isoprenylcysteine O-methyltransferase